MFGSVPFCELLRKCRAKGLTFSQMQVLALLNSSPASKSQLADLAGMTMAGAVKSVNCLIKMGDVVKVDTTIVRGRRVDIYGLSEQGISLIRDF